jgi:hypothetical protein
LRIFGWNFSRDSADGVFAYLISDWTIYIEKSYGNYMYLSNDANLIRNAGLCLFVAILNGLVFLILRIGFKILYSSKKYKNDKIFKLMKYKKIIYRLLECIHKSVVYQLIYFSLSTL